LAYDFLGFILNSIGGNSLIEDEILAGGTVV